MHLKHLIGVSHANLGE